MYRFSHQQQPELPSALAAEFVDYGPRCVAPRVLLSEAVDFSRVPDGLEPVGTGLELLRLFGPRVGEGPHKP